MHKKSSPVVSSSQKAASSREPRRTSGKRQPKRMLNVPLLVGTLIAVAILSPAAYFWHSYQVGHSAVAMLDRATSLEDEAKNLDAEAKSLEAEAKSFEAAEKRLKRDKQWRMAAEYLFRYLRLKPADEQARVRLAEVFDESAKDRNGKRRAIELYYRAVGIASTSEQADVRGKEFDLRRRLAELLLGGGLFGSAEEEAKKLKDDDPDGWRLLGVALYGQFQRDTLPTREAAKQRTWAADSIGTAFEQEGGTADKAFLRALELNPQDVQSAAILAIIYRDRDAEPLLCKDNQDLTEAQRQQEADNVINRMVADNPTKPEALVARYRYRTEFELEQADEDLDEALKHGPDDLDVLQLAADRDRSRAAGARRDAAGARQKAAGAQQDAERDRQEAKRNRQEARRARQAGRSADEIGRYDSEATRLDKEATKYDGEAITHDKEAARLDNEAITHDGDAIKRYEHITKNVAPTNPSAYVSLGDLYLSQGKGDLAIEQWQLGLMRGDKENVLLNLRLAGTLIARGEVDAEKALDALDRALVTYGARWPRSQVVSLERSVGLLRADWFLKKGKYFQAVPLLRKVALAQHVTTAEVQQGFLTWLKLGRVCFFLRQWESAAAAFEEAAALMPKRVQPRILAANSWANADKIDKAVRNLERALELEDNPDTWFALARMRFKQEKAKNPETEQRNWDPFRRALDKARAPGGNNPPRNPWRIALLETDYNVVRGLERNPAEEVYRNAVDELRRIEKAYVGSAPLLERLVTFYERLGCPEDADRALEQLELHAENPELVCIIRSNLYVGREQYERARQELDKGLKTLPPTAHAGLKQRLAEVTLREGDSGAASKMASTLHQRYPSNPRYIRLLAEFAIEAGNSQEEQRWKQKLRETEGPDGRCTRYFQARRLLEDTTDTSDPNFTEATGLLAQLQREHRNWAPSHLLNGMRLQTRGELQKAVNEYRTVLKLGEQRVLAYERLISVLCRLQRFDEAGEYLANAQRRKLSSKRLGSLEIVIAAAQGNLDEAIAFARRAVEKRPKDPQPRIQLGQALLSNDKKKEAEAAFKKAVQLAPTDTRALDALFGFYVRTEQLERAKKMLQEFAANTSFTEVERASVLARGYEVMGEKQKAKASYHRATQLVLKNAAKPDPKDAAKPDPKDAAKLDPKDVAVLQREAAFLLRFEYNEEAKKVLRRIVDLRLTPSSVRALDMLFGLYVNTKQLEAAEESLQGLAANKSLTEVQRALVLAQGYELMEEKEKAKVNYQRATRLAPKDVAVLERAATFLLRTDLDEAESFDEAASIVDRIVKLVPNAGYVRRRLATVLTKHGGEKGRQKAERLLEQADANEEPSSFDQRLQAGVLLRRGGKENREKAQRILEALIKNAADPVPNDRRSLAQIHEANGKLQAAREQFLKLVDRPDPNISHLASYIDFLLRHDLSNEVDPWLEKLEELSPDDLGVTSLRARWLDSQGRESEIEPLVEGLADKLLNKLGEDSKVPKGTAEKLEAQLALSIGSLYSAVQQHEAAERWYQRLRKVLPERYDRLAASLAQQGRITEAIRLCQEAAKTDSSPRPAMILAMVLTTTQPDDEEFQLAEPLLSKAIKDHPENLRLLLSVAGVRVKREQVEQAVELYRKVLELKPKDVQTLNNLATLLSEQADMRDEALEYIERAIEVDGQQSFLLDTKGMILVLDQKADQAVEYLELAVAVPAPDPRFHFHLAVAYHQIGEIDKARDALKKAQDNDFTKRILTKTDKAFLSELERELR